MGKRRWQLTYISKSRRWKKKHAGKIYYFSLEPGETKESSYHRCFSLWNAKKDALERTRAARPHEREYAYLISKLGQIATWFEQQNGAERSSTEVASWKDKLQEAQALAARFTPPEPRPEEDPFNGVDDASRWLWLERLHSVSPKSATAATLSQVINANLERSKVRVDAGELSPQRYEAYRSHLSIFCKWFGTTRAIEDVKSPVLEDFHSHLLQRIDPEIRGKSWDDNYSPKYAKDVLGSVKQFLRRCWERGDIIDLPRNINSPDISIKHSPSPPVVVPDEHIRKVLNVCSERTKLYIYLMLNTGMQQKDIAQLRHDEVDWESGRLIRKRQKTRKYSSVPVVTYKLWPETFRLLKTFRSDDAKLALLNEDGLPLYQEKIKPNGKLSKVDNLRSALLRAMDHAEVRFAPKLLRKTSASKLASNPQFRSLSALFLGHAPTTVAERYYIAESSTVLDDALDWLHDQLIASETSVTEASAAPIAP